MCLVTRLFLRKIDMRCGNCPSRKVKRRNKVKGATNVKSTDPRA